MNTINLPLSVEWWTPERLAKELGVSTRTIYKRHDELAARGLMVRRSRCVWTRSEAQALANYIAALWSPRKNMADNVRVTCE